MDLGVIAADGRHLAYVGPHDLKKKNYSRAVWFSTVQARGSYISDVFLGFRNVPHCVVAVKGGRRRPSWVLRATINSDTFNSLVRTGQFGSTGDAFIIDTRGYFQTPPKTGRVLQPSPITSPRQHRGVRESRIAHKEGAVIRVTKWLNRGRWMLVVQQDEGEIMAPVHHAMTIGALVILIAVGLIVVTTFLATGHLTDRIRRAQEQRDGLSRDLLRSARLASLGEMASGLAHEINNPLAIISAAQTNIADQVGDLELDAVAREDLMVSVARCQRQVDRCSSITSKMLQFGRKAESRLRPTDVVPLLQDISGLMRQQAVVRNIDLRLEFEPDLPRVMLDGTELQQVLVNLINNAMYAIGERGGVTISARQVGGEVELAVEDDGGGIGPGDLEHIFQPFYTTKPVGQGTGLGLAVCHGIVLGWGGTIHASSEPGAGTRMTIRLPSPRKKPTSSGPEQNTKPGSWKSPEARS